MFERFTDRARQVVVLAHEEARRFGHHHVGSEHVLLGVAREDQGLGARVLRARGITDDRLGTRLGESPWVGQASGRGSLPFSARARRGLDLAAAEADALGSEMICTHALLLGLLRVTDGGAVRVLAELGAHPPAVREQLLADLSTAPAEWPASMQQPAEFHTRRVAAPGHAKISREARREHHRQAIEAAHESYRDADTSRRRALAREQIEFLDSITQLL